MKAAERVNSLKNEPHWTKIQDQFNYYDMEEYAKEEVEENIEQTIIDFANFTNKDTDWALITTNDIRQYMNHILTQKK